MLDLRHFQDAISEKAVVDPGGGFEEQKQVVAKRQGRGPVQVQRKWKGCSREKFVYPDKDMACSVFQFKGSKGIQIWPHF